MSQTSANAEAIEAWNTFLFDKFLRYRPYVVDGLGIHGLAALDRYPPPPGGRVLDPAMECFIVELTASEAEINSFIVDLARQATLLEVARSGALGMGRSARGLRVVR